MKKSMQRPAFTLIETMRGLTIGVLVLFTVTLVLQQLHRNLAINYQLVQQFDNAMMNLSNPKASFRYEGREDDKILLTGQTHAGEFRHYRLVVRGSRLIMTTDKGGFMPLVEHVAQAHLDYHENCLSIMVKPKHGQKMTRLIFVPEMTYEI